MQFIFMTFLLKALINAMQKNLIPIVICKKFNLNKVFIHQGSISCTAFMLILCWLYVHALN